MANSKTVNITVAAVTFGLFMTEALLHYNMGVHKDKKETRPFVLPPTKDFVKLAVVVGFFSIANGVIINKITHGIK